MTGVFGVERHQTERGSQCEEDRDWSGATANQGRLRTAGNHQSYGSCREQVLS